MSASSAPTLRLVVADDHPLYREGVVRVLEDAGGLTILAEAEDADGAVAAVQAHAPDLVLLDISMPGGGIEALRRIRALPAPPRVAMLTVSEEDDDILRALKAGAQGYVLKGIRARDLVRVVRDLAAGRSYVSPSLAARVLEAMQSEHDRAGAMDTLTPRETEILRAVSSGASNREVAEQLGLQEKTVKHHMTAILQKLEVRNRTEAALKAREHWRGQG